MPSNNPSGRHDLENTTRKTIERLVTEKTNTRFEELSTLVKETEARTKAIFSQIHNLQVEIGEMTTKLALVFTEMHHLVERPESAGDAMSIIKDFVFNVTKKKK